MRLKVAAVLVAFLALEVHTPPSVDACGVKLSVKPTAPRKAVARTSNPSEVLLVGSPPRRLANDLSVAGHKVEQVQDPSAAKRERYGVVIVDSDKQASAARERFANAIVIVRSGNVRDDLQAVESRVTRTAVAAATARPVVAARDDRAPVAAGPDRTQPKEVVTAKAPEPAVAVVEPSVPTPPNPTPAPTPTPRPDPAPRVTTTTAKPVETPRTAKPVVADSAVLREEIFFQLGGKRVARSRPLDRAVTWLNANTGVNVVVEGHADPSGTPGGNLALSEARANEVKSYLVANGIDGGRIEVKPMGDTQLKYGATDGRNRRAAIQATR